MSLTKADLEAIAGIVDARIAQANVAPAKAASRGKAPKDARTIVERRADAAGGECVEHGKRFATAKGARWHAANIAHKA